MQDNSLKKNELTETDIRASLEDDVKLRWVVLATILPIAFILSKNNTQNFIWIFLLGVVTASVNLLFKFYIFKFDFFLRKYSYITGFFDITVATCAIYLTGGMASPLFLLYFIIILDSVFEYWAKYIYLHLSALTLAEYFLIYMIAGKGNFINAHTPDFFIRMVFYFVLGIMSYYIARAMRNQYLNMQRITSEKETLYEELLDMNRKLEVRVKKSTEDLERTNFLLVKKNISLLAAHEIYKTANEANDAAELLNMTLGITVPLMKGAGGAILLADHGLTSAKLESYKRFVGPQMLDNDREFDLKNSPQLVDMISKRRAIVWESITEGCDEILKEVVGEGSCIATPLVMRSGITGIMIVFNKDPYLYKKTDIELMELLGEQVGSLLYGRQMLEEVKVRAAGLEKLMKVIINVEATIDESEIVNMALQDGIKNIFPYCSGVVVVVDETNQLKIKFQYGQKAEIVGKVLPVNSVAGWSTKNGRALFVKNVEKLKFYNPDVDSLYLKGPSIVSPIFKKGKTIGAMCITRPRSFFGKEDSHFLTILSNHIGILLETAGLYTNIKRDYINTIYALAAAVDAKDHYTHGHSTTVMKYSVKIAEEMQLKPEQVEDIKYAALLHDIGKIGISENILNKPAKLTKEEYAIIKMHPQLGANIISKIDSLKKLAPLILAHHEWANGSGYPLGLRGDEIPLGARIISVSDAYSTMTSKRPYRDIMGDEYAIKEFKKYDGLQFDPKITAVLITILHREEKEILEAQEREKKDAEEKLAKEKAKKDKSSRIRVNLDENTQEHGTSNIRKDGDFYS